MNIFYYFFLYTFLYKYIISIVNNNNNSNNKSEDSNKTYFDKNNYVFIDSKEYNNQKIIIIENKIKKRFIIELNYISYDTLNLVIKPLNNTSYFELPKQNPFPFHKNNSKIKLNYNLLKYHVNIVYNPFIIYIIRKSTKEILFQSDINNPFDFLYNFVYFFGKIPSKYIYGFGFRTTTFNLHTGRYTFYNKDNPNNLDYGKGDGHNRYGSHPMYLTRENSGYFHINFLRNSFPMDIDINLIEKKILYLITGGILDFSFFLGDKNPENIIEKYHNFLGGWNLPPFWSMGLHQSRWGYKNINNLHDILNDYKTNKIPIDCIWLDIDYMERNHPCTWDKEKFPYVKFKNLLNIFQTKFILVSEPVIGYNSKELFNLGKNYDIFLKSLTKPKNPNDNEYLLNKQWPGISYYLDPLHPNVSKFMEYCHDFLYDISNFSGIWVDMNEMSAFISGEITKDEKQLKCNAEDYPYYPGGYYLEHKTLCPNVKHYNNFTHIQIHNYLGNIMLEYTKKYLKKKFPNEFPFLLTRANAPGIGKYSFLWSGDNGSNYTWYKLSLSEVFNMNLLGVPMSGTDVCGFMGETNNILCAKWYQVGSLFPFFRIHRHLNFNNNDPFSMGKILENTAKYSIIFRYKILKYYYSLFMIKKHTGTIFRPLFFEFPDDMHLYEESILNTQFLIGSNLLCIPNMNYFNKSDVLAYFPMNNDWYDLREFVKIKKNGFNIIDVNLENILGIYLRGGHTMFLNENIYIENSYDLNEKLILYIGFKNYFDYLYVSFGKIPILKDFNNKYEILNVINKNLYLDIYSIFDLKKLNLQINFIKNIEYNSCCFENIKIKEIILFFSFNIKDIKFKKNDLINKYYYLSSNVIRIIFFNYNVISAKNKIIEINLNMFI